MARKAFGALKDSTMVGMAKVNSEYKKLDVAILKATNHVELLPKEKHVALKTLIVIHRAMREVDISFLQELVNYNAQRGHLLNLTHFKDDTSTNAWDYSTWIRSYALYLEEYLECFSIMRYDFQRERKRIKELNTAVLIDTLPALQQLLSRLLHCQPVGAAQYNYLIQHALSIVAAESAGLYVAIADGMLNLVDKFFEMQRADAVRGLEIYRKAGDQAVKLSEFFEVCRNLDFGRGQKYVKIERPPQSFISAMEEYLKDAPNMLMLPWKPDDDDSSTKVIAVPDSQLETDQEQVTVEVAVKEEATAPPLIPNLLSFDEPSQETAASEDNDALALVISTPELSNSMISSDENSEPPGWELELITASNSNQGVSSKLIEGGVLDRSKLDSLYETALARQNLNDPYNSTEVSLNPFEAAQDVNYSNSSSMNNAQMAAMAHYHDYGIIVQHQIANMPQTSKHQVLLQQQMASREDMNGQAKANPFGNPFTDQDVTTNTSQDQSSLSRQNQNSQASLI